MTKDRCYQASRTSDPYNIFSFYTHMTDISEQDQTILSEV